MLATILSTLFFITYLPRDSHFIFSPRVFQQLLLLPYESEDESPFNVSECRIIYFVNYDRSEPVKVRIIIARYDR